MSQGTYCRRLVIQDISLMRIINKLFQLELGLPQCFFNGVTYSVVKETIFLFGCNSLANCTENITLQATNE